MAEPDTLLYTPVPTVTAPGGLYFVGHAFDQDGYTSTTPLPGLELGAPLGITIVYTDTQVARLAEMTLVLYYWGGMARAWQDAACGAYQRSPAENWLAVPVCQLGQFALFGREGHVVYLPLLLRNP